MCETEATDQRLFALVCGGGWIVTIVGALVISTSAQAEYRFDFEHWYGQSFDLDDGRFGSCIASLHNSNDQLLLIKLDEDFDLSIGVSDDGWDAKLGDIVPVQALLDHSLLYGGPAVAISKEIYYMHLTQTDRSLNLMQGAQKMLIQIRKQSVLFKLKGITPTLNSLIACVKHDLDEHSTI